jgi:SAM-dependent methyltransferase
MARRAGGWRVPQLRGRYELTPEQALALADPNGPVNVPGAFTLALGAVAAVPAITEAFRTGAGFGWHEQHPDVFVGCEQFFRAGYAAHLVQDWLPALDGAVDKLRAGGLGASTVLLAEAFPVSRFAGSDYHEGSVALATKRAADAGVTDRVSFETASAQTFTGTGYDLVTTFDCLHDMGDPAGAARHIRQALAPDGSWLIVEPMASDTLEGNLNPVGRVYYNFSTLLCLPNARSQHGGAALGAQAGEAAIRDVVLGAGFGTFLRAAETPFNLVYEARP